MFTAKRAAFTLMEIIIVISIIGVLMAYMVPKIFKQLGQADVKRYQMKLNGIKEGLITYRMTFDRYPLEKEGLKILTDDEVFKKKAGIEAPLKEDDIIDQNNQEVIYHCPPQKFKGNPYKQFELLWIGTGSEEEPQLNAGN
jgi:type II secretion system protein G